MDGKKRFNAAAEKTTLTVEGISHQDIELLRRLIRAVIRFNDRDDPLLYRKKDEINPASISKFIHLALKEHFGEEYYLRHVRQSAWEINTEYEASKNLPDNSNG